MIVLVDIPRLRALLEREYDLWQEGKRREVKARRKTSADARRLRLIRKGNP